MGFKKLAIGLLVAIFCFSVIGCGSGTGEQGKGEKPKEVFVKIATGNTGGTYYPVGVAMGQMFSKKIPGVVSSAMSTGGSVDNISLLRTNEAQVATLMETIAEWAYRGEEEFTNKKYDGLRAMTSLWPNLNHIVVHKSIKTFDDLKGKKFVVGAARSGTEIDSYAILSSVGLYYRDDSGPKKNLTPVWVNYAEAVEGMKNLQIAGGTFNTFPPGSAVTDLLSTGDFHILSFTDEQIANLAKTNPLYTGYDVPAGTYPNQSAAVKMPGYPNLLVTTTQVDTDTVYNMTKVIFENIDDLVAAHKASSLIKLETATKGIQIPFHDGAKKYFEEKGVLKKQ